MLFRHFKGQPHDYVIRFLKGKVAAHGNGLEFWYMPHNTTMAIVPTASQDAPFIFHETTTNFQEVAVQGLLSYRFAEPMKVAKIMDFTINPLTGRYLQQDKDKLAQRIVNLMQDNARQAINALPLRDALTGIQHLCASILETLRADPFLQEAGIVIETLHFTSIQPAPEMKQALEAEYRESLKGQADRAIYERRTAAVDEERKIKQSEMQTKIDIEQRRKTLVDLEAQNELTLAEAHAKAEEMRLDPYVNLPPQALVGLAFKEFAGNAGKIGNLTITPDMIGQVMGWMNARSGADNGKKL